MNPYLGHDSQLCGVEEHRLVGGKGDGLRLFEVHNAAGLDLTVSADRNCDISRLRFCGINMSYFSPCGYVAPAYYDSLGDHWLQSFTAGFLTTCGLNNVGVPNCDNGEELPLHGSIGNTPAEHVWWEETEEAFEIHAVIKDERIFGRKLRLHRTVSVAKSSAEFSVTDTIENTGSADEPMEILYHMNMGYPLLSEHSELFIPSVKVQPRNARAAEGLDSWGTMLPPQDSFEEQCYFHSFEKNGLAAIYNPDIAKGLVIRFDAELLPYFTEWKMMGCRDYVLGLEPGNCHPDGRSKMREDGTLKILKPGEKITYRVGITMLDGKAAWDSVKK